jgi:hypothetical protein
MNRRTKAIGSRDPSLTINQQALSGVLPMKWLPITLWIVLLLAAAPAFAKKPAAVAPVFGGTISPGELTPTPEMWFYEQYMRQYMDPQMAVRQRAEFRADQRNYRIAARRWFGFSNLRPTASTDPYNSDYSPHWVGNNRVYPDRWSGGNPVVVAVPTSK